MKWWAVTFPILLLKLAIFLRICQVHENKAEVDMMKHNYVLFKQIFCLVFSLSVVSDAARHISLYEIILIYGFSCSRLHVLD